MPNSTRWVLVIPGAFIAMLATALIGAVVYLFAQHAWCDLDGDVCLNQAGFEKLAVLGRLWVGLDVAAFIATATAIAPLHKTVVAWTIFTIGLVLIVIQFSGGYLSIRGVPDLFPLLAGVVTCLLITKLRVK